MSADVEGALHYLGEVVRPLCHHGEVDMDVRHFDRVLEVGGESSVVPIVCFRIAVPAEDVRFVLGRHGATAEALRTLLRAWAGSRGWTGKIDVDVRPKSQMGDQDRQETPIEDPHGRLQSSS
jgi:predicted RNA-binding protein YlqC (UPF0109 family)